MDRDLDKTRPIYDSVLSACRRIISMDGNPPTDVTARSTIYVVDGRIYTIRTGKGNFAFWLGINGPRLFFIVYIEGLQPDRAKEAFSFCFGGAEKVGWHVNYEPIPDGVSIWATCFTDPSKPLAAALENAGRGLSNEPIYKLTDDGHFWATDIAMMAQSWIRTSERNGLACHELEPAPL